jgi:tRNA pseudouridine55 synthase
MQGLLLVDKPAGWTSFDVVNYVRKVVAQAENKKPKQIKTGHTGTLDPFATGLLVLLIGKEYTKRAGELSKVDKTYELSFRLGQTSSTGDPEGKISPVSDVVPGKKALLEAIKHFTGQIEQIPPAYSAVKINGQRAYKLARAGKRVRIEPRQVTIKKLELLDYTYPEIELVATVSSGTYIRSLVEDIGNVLGTGAYTTALKRLQVGEYDLAAAVNLKSISTSNILSCLKVL